MPSGDEFSADAIGVIEELAEFQPVITNDARIGRPAGGVFVDEIVDDLVEFSLQIEGVEGDL